MDSIEVDHHQTSEVNRVLSATDETLRAATVEEKTLNPTEEWTLNES